MKAREKFAIENPEEIDEAYDQFDFIEIHE